jgi:hypothetical protein
MTDTGTLVLTDDEAAAIALQAGGALRAPFPTVDQASETDLTSAVRRGRRSLVVRELAEPDGTPRGQAAEMLARLGAGPCATFRLVDGDGRWVPAGPTIYLYGRAPDRAELSHVIAAAGVHYFRVAPPPGQWLALTELAEAVFASGFTAAEAGSRPPAAAVLSVTGQGGVRTILVGRGEASAGIDAERVTFTSAADAVAWMRAES